MAKKRRRGGGGCQVIISSQRLAVTVLNVNISDQVIVGCFQIILMTRKTIL